MLMEVKEIQDRLPSFIGKKTELKNIHLTLKFLGEISSEKVKEIKERLKKINLGKFESEIKERGIFDNRKSRKYSHELIVWVSLANCEKLQKEIDLVLEDMFQKEKRFMAHITLARVKEVQDKDAFLKKLKVIPLKKMFFIVDKFYLTESKLKKEGPEYADIDEYFLI